MPQGFGFEARKTERRALADRRAKSDRRLAQRRQHAARILLDRRNTERRKVDRRISQAFDRRLTDDRRSGQSRRSRGLRITVEIDFEFPDENGRSPTRRYEDSGPARDGLPDGPVPS